MHQWLLSRQIKTFVTHVEATTCFADAAFDGPAAIVLGSEDRGVSPFWSQAPGVCAIRLPMLGVADSLNVAATAAVLFYEAWRQRR